MSFFQKLIQEKYLNIQAKLVLPLLITILLMLAVLTPVTKNLINTRIEQDADLRLGDIADSVGELMENSEYQAYSNASLLANQPEIAAAFGDLEANKNAVLKEKETLRLQEISLYKADFANGDTPYYYGGPTVARRLQVNENALKIREDLILNAIKSRDSVSGVSVAPQNSQLIGVAPVFDPQTHRLMGVVLAAFYMDQAYIENISKVIKTDIAVVKNNAVIVSTIDEKAGYTKLINDGWLTSSDLPATNVVYQNGKSYRMLAHPLLISDAEQGSLLVAQPIDQLFRVSRDIQIVFYILIAAFGLTALWFWIAALTTFTRPLAQLTEATTRLKEGELNQKVETKFLVFRDEITVLTENFNSMAAHLHELYSSLEERVHQRTLELAEARDDAIAANKSKSEFVSVVSHELKLPMTSIKGYSDLMLSGATGALNENQTNFLTTIRNNVNRMATQVSDLSDISRIESGNLRLEPRIVNAHEVLQEVVSLTKTHVDQKKQTLTLDLPSDLPDLWCDRNRFSQVLINLLSNANKYTPEGGSLSIQAWREGGMVQIKVQDNGLGMSDDDQRKLFTKFFRSPDQKVRDIPGTGLGLSITKNLIELQGGRIWFESELGKGTTFHFTTPIQNS